jgi:hypothetical protein
LKSEKLNKTVKRQSGDFQNRPKMTKNGPKIDFQPKKQGLQTGTFEARGAFRQTANPTISDRL